MTGMQSATLNWPPNSSLLEQFESLPQSQPAEAQPVLDVQIISISSHMAAPTPADCVLKTPYNIFSEPLKQVPIIRIFGTTKTKQRICLHVHQAWPYMYIRYDGPSDLESVREFGYQLGLSLNHALNISFKSTTPQTHVAAVIPVKGVPFYGYHTGYQPFMKILLSNPGVVSRASMLLASGAVMNQKFDLFESHLPYTLQFLVDYNLFGMDWVNLANVRFRSPLPAIEENEMISDATVCAEQRWVPNGMPAYLINPQPPSRISRCELEADAAAADILNRQQVPERHVHHVFNEGRLGMHFGKLVHSLGQVWADENQRRITNGMKSLQQQDSQVEERKKHASSADGQAEKTKPELQWSNHWRMQSLLQSALANDRQHVDRGASSDSFGMWEGGIFNSEDTGGDVALENSSIFLPNTAGTSNPWIDLWPTCREVDTGEICLISSAGEHRSHFYLEFALSPPSQQPSPNSSPAFKLDLEVLETPPLLSQGSQLSQTRALVDESIISQNASDIEHGDHSPNGSDVDALDELLLGEFGSVSQKSEFDEFGDLDILDNSWIESELKKIDDTEYTSVSRHIPQADGAGDDDDSDDFLPAGGSKIAGSRSSGRRRYRTRRAMMPLALKSSRKVSSDIEQRKSSHSSDFDDKFEEVRQSLNPPKRQRQGESSQTRESSALDSWSARKAVSQSGKVPKQGISSNCYVDIVLPTRCGSESEEIRCIPSSPEFATDVSGHQSVHVDDPIDSSKETAAQGTSQTAGAKRAISRVCEGPPISGANNDISPIFDEEAGGIAIQLLSPSTQASNDEAMVVSTWSETEVFRFAKPPPTVKQLLASLGRYNLPEMVNPVPFFSKKRDLPSRGKTYGGTTIKFASADPSELPVFDPVLVQDLDNSDLEQVRVERLERQQRRQQMWSPTATSAINAAMSLQRQKYSGMGDGWWEFAKRPPCLHTAAIGDVSDKHSTVESQAAAISSDALHTPVRKRQRDQSDLKWSSVLGKLSTFTTTPSKSATPTKLSTSQQLRRIGKLEKVALSQMSLEIITSTRDRLLPDPKLDPILCMVGCMVIDKPQWDASPYSGCKIVVWTHGEPKTLTKLGFPSHVDYVNLDDEHKMISELTRWVCRHDPDILCGYEVQNSSWGYLVERADIVYGMRLCSDLSRIVDPPWRRQTNGYGRDQDSWGYKKGAALSIGGRHVLNVWRLMRGELALTSYSFEKIVAEVLKERVPHFTLDKVSQWFVNGPTVATIRALRHAMYRARTSLRLLDTMDIVHRASEFASIIGIDFDSVITRGSQLRVESLMARIAHPELFILSSPTREQVAQQRAAECLPLVLEPQSRYYTDPVVVLDFQSLYPSIMIAYNYCFSTCLGSVEDAASHAPGAEQRIGFTDVRIPPGTLSKLRDHITVSPNGVVFVKPTIRKGLLGRMLREILDTRVMLKDAMKTWGDDEALCKSLDARQLGLKLIANVTYGYAGASFSGRMPCVEIADAIVQSGRETLENAIRFIHSKHAEWGAKVVYGDTDSVFVHFPGKSRQTAFRLGHEIAAAVTAINPAPVELKFEKVYQPCVLLTKKRYAGWMYTTPEQVDPLLDVKGMELVRRDGCVATQKILEGAMDRLFGTNDLSLVKTFVTGELTKVLQGAYPPMDFFVAKEVRMGTYSGHVLPPHAKVSMDDMQSDARAEPQYGERVPYVVVDGGPNARLTDQVVRPLVLLNRPELRLNYQYYVTKQIVPALDRVLSLAGVDVNAWVNDMPRHRRKGLYDSLLDVFVVAKPTSDGTASLDGAARRQAPRRTLDHFYHERSCLLCRQSIAHLPSPGRPRSAADSLLRVCNACLRDKPALMVKLAAVQMDIDQASKSVLDKCAECVGVSGNRADSLVAAECCDSLDCPTMFDRRELARRSHAWARLRSELDESGAV